MKPSLSSPTLFERQPALPGLCPIETAVEEMSESGIEARGAVFTKQEVVEFILDLVGYTDERPLYRRRILEPSFGNGDFLLPLVCRLLNSYRRANLAGDPVESLRNSVCGVELHLSTFLATTSKLQALLKSKGLTVKQAKALVAAWLKQDDFLLAELDGRFDYVVGNPPYVRQELIPEILIKEYRRRFSTIYDRADIYIPFIERSLGDLRPGGVLGLICADRWTKNRYGGPLRRLVADSYHLRAYIDMVDTPAFLSDVIAYPGIFIIANERGQITRVARRPKIDRRTLKTLSDEITGVKPLGNAVAEVPIATNGREPWLFDAFDQLSLVRRLEAMFPTLEDVGCRVGIGVATGADKVFIAPFDKLDVEPNRKLPLVMTRDILSGEIKWRGYGVVNPFDNDGLVRLQDYPRLRRYMEVNRDPLIKRHCAKKSPASWYRTIDRITPDLVLKPKLLIPDIKGEAHIVYDEGHYYPHHNLYFITSSEWDLRALQAVLLSGIARLFVAAYSVKMRGDYLRFQAQYLRRIRVPSWHDVPSKLRRELITAVAKRDQAACNLAAFKLYGLSLPEQAALTERREAA